VKQKTDKVLNRTAGLSNQTNLPEMERWRRTKGLLVMSQLLPKLSRVHSLKRVRGQPLGEVYRPVDCHDR